RDDLAGRKDARGNVRLEVVRKIGLRGRFRQQVARGVLEPRRVRHQVAQCDRLAEARRDLEIEVAVDVAVQVELVLLDQLHHRGPGEQLRDRADPEQRVCRRDRRAGLQVGIAVAVREQHLAVLHHHDRAAGDIAPRQHVRQQAAEECREIIGSQRMRCRRWRGRGDLLVWGGLRHLREGRAGRASEHECHQDVHNALHGDAPSGRELWRLKVAISSPTTSHAPPNRNVMRSKPVKMKPTTTNPHSGKTRWRTGRVRSPRRSQKYAGTDRLSNRNEVSAPKFTSCSSTTMGTLSASTSDSTATNRIALVGVLKRASTFARKPPKGRARSRPIANRMREIADCDASALATPVASALTTMNSTNSAVPPTSRAIWKNPRLSSRFA